MKKEIVIAVKNNRIKGRVLNRKTIESSLKLFGAKIIRITTISTTIMKKITKIYLKAKKVIDLNIKVFGIKLITSLLMQYFKFYLKYYSIQIFLSLDVQISMCLDLGLSYVRNEKTSILPHVV